MKTQIKSKFKNVELLIIMAVFGGAGFGAYTYFISDYIVKTKKAKTDLESEKKDIKQNKENLVKMKDTLKSLGGLDDSPKNIEAKYDLSLSLSDFIKDMYSFSIEALKIQKIAFADVKSEDGLKKTFLELEVTSTFEGMANFVNKIEDSKHPVSITSTEITRSGKDMKMCFAKLKITATNEKSN